MFKGPYLPVHCWPDSYEVPIPFIYVPHCHQALNTPLQLMLKPTADSMLYLSIQLELVSLEYLFKG